MALPKTHKLLDEMIRDLERSLGLPSSKDSNAKTLTAAKPEPAPVSAAEKKSKPVCAGRNSITNFTEHVNYIFSPFSMARNKSKIKRRIQKRRRRYAVVRNQYAMTANRESFD